MNKLFNNILVPVDFSNASELAIEKAIDIANHFKCNIHLVFAPANRIGKKYGQRSSSNNGSTIDGSTVDRSTVDAEARLSQLQNRYTTQLHPGLLIHSSLRKGNMNRAVIEYTLRHNIDLVIIGKSGGLVRNLISGTYSINEITKHIECPVLTVRKDTASDKWMNIVLPVCSVLPIRKIMFASYLARKYNSRIHLLAMADDENGKSADSNKYLSKAYQLLRDNTNLMIECHMIRGHNIADTTLRFAQKINADLIVINPGQESRLPGFVNKLLDGSLFSNSKIPVMTISAV
jgi:nucleotide-binding universal stress UspA family protein